MRLSVLTHAWDFVEDIFVDYRPWYIQKDEFRDIIRGAHKREIYASHVENMIRAENDLHLRAYYSTTSFGPAGLINNGKSLHFSASEKSCRAFEYGVDTLNLIKMRSPFLIDYY